MENIRYKILDVKYTGDGYDNIIGYMPSYLISKDLKRVLPRIMHCMLYSVSPVNISNHPTIL